MNIYKYLTISHQLLFPTLSRLGGWHRRMTLSFYSNSKLCTWTAHRMWRNVYFSCDVHVCISLIHDFGLYCKHSLPICPVAWIRSDQVVYAARRYFTMPVIGTMGPRTQELFVNKPYSPVHWAYMIRATIQCVPCPSLQTAVWKNSATLDLRLDWEASSLMHFDCEDLARMGHEMVKSCLGAYRHAVDTSLPESDDAALGSKT